MTRNELVASQMQTAAILWASGRVYYDDHAQAVAQIAIELADEMISRGIVKVSEEAKEPA